MNTWVATLKRMLGGAVVGSMMLVGGVAEAGAARIHLETVDGSGNVEAVAGETIFGRQTGECLIASPTDGLHGTPKHPCIVLNFIVNHVLGQLVGEPADLMASPTDALVASGNSQTASLIASPTDARRPLTVRRPVVNTLMASPTDGKTMPASSLMASPTDGRGIPSLMASPTDGRHSMRWVLVTFGQNGRFSTLIDLAEPAPARVQLDGSTTLATEAALALVDLGVQPDDIDLELVFEATSGLNLRTVGLAAVLDAASAAIDQRDNGGCALDGSLAGSLCSALR